MGHGRPDPAVRLKPGDRFKFLQSGKQPINVAGIHGRDDFHDNQRGRRSVKQGGHIANHHEINFVFQQYPQGFQMFDAVHDIL